MQKTFGWLILVTLLALAGCTGGGSAPSGAVQAVENYYRAIVERDDDALVQTTCADWEEQALLEFDSFQGVETELEGLTCAEQAGGSAEEAQVTCSGKIVASYGNELMDFPLDDRQHRVVNQGGDWRICGY